ncbi:uncharacterized protein LOC127853755 [Dreissena polymorpha]|uniref:uncharacterized protein LOC127853755 n=1 Tax=Dreissena polymorpha TaxID=45954 RepID=UPI002263D477|nr:uncharacterized protein LOC127853755 [Dreissena polymorpha]
MSDYRDIFRRPETQNWFKAAMGMNITRECLLDIVKEAMHEFYHTIRKEIKRKHGIPEIAVCSQCHTANVLPCDTDNKCCKYRKCEFHAIYKPQNCPGNNLCNNICKEIVENHRFRNRSKPKSVQGPTWVNTDACKWCVHSWQIAKCYLSKDGYKDANKAEDTDFNGIVNVIYNCEFFQRYFTDDLSQTENVCTKARDVGRDVRHAPSNAMTQQESDRAIDTLVALLQSLKNADHQGASKSAVDKITQLKNNTLAITDEDVTKILEAFRESLTEEIKRILLYEKDKHVVTMENTGKSITAEIIKAGEEQIAIIKRTHEDNSCIKSKRARKGLDSDQDLGRTGNDIASIESPFARDSPLFKIKAWLIEQYQSKCVAPVSMLDPDIDVPLERIYVPPSIKELKRGQEDRCGGIETDNTSRGENDVSCYKELLHRDGNQNNTMYIQGDPGCGKTTFSTKLVLDWCNAHSENGASTKKKRKVTTRGKASNRTGFSDLDTLRDYKFLFFVSLRDYSGTMCNVSQMVEEAIQSNKLPWDDSVWEDKCIVLTDAADEWHHPDPSKSNSACKCKDRSMPQFLQRNNITNIITARPWKLANLKMSDTSTRIFQISGVLDYKILAENVINVLAEKDGISQKAQQSKLYDFLKKLENKNMGNLMTIPAICVQLVHQYYVGRLIEDSLCSIYMNMLDMHIANGLHKLQIEDFDTEEICVKEIEHIFETGKNEYMSANGSLIRSACALAFKTLTHSSKESSLVFAENTMTNHMTKTQVDYLLQTGIITKKKSLALSQQKNIPYMFVHKTIQEFLASMHIAINQTDIEDILKDIQRVYCDGESILDIGQLFIFTCGMCVPVAERMSKHMMDVITSDMKSKLLSISDQEMDLFSTPYLAQRILLGGFIERLANKQPCLQLTLTHIALDDFRSATIKEIDALNTLIDMNISNITSMDAFYFSNSQQLSNRVQEIISQSRESLSYLRLRDWIQSDQVQYDLQGLKLKSLLCYGGTVLSNLDCTYMRSCSILYPTPLSEGRILQSMSITGKNITRLQLMDVQSIDLLCAALPTLTSLHTLTIYWTTPGVTLLSSLPESIRKVVYIRSNVSAQDVKSMVVWSKSRDACVRCVLLDCRITANNTETCNWMKQQDGIDITQCEFKEYGISKDWFISVSWSTILSK